MLYPILEPSSLHTVMAQPEKRDANRCYELCWSSNTDTERNGPMVHSYTIEEDLTFFSDKPHLLPTETIPLIIAEETDLSIFSILITSPTGEKEKGIIKKHNKNAAGKITN